MAALWAVSDAPLHRKVSDASMAAAAKFGFSCLLLRASAAAERRGAEEQRLIRVILGFK